MTRSGDGLSAWADDDSSAQVLARYDEWAGDYEGDVERWGYALPNAIVAAANAAGVVPGARILDAGCGTGLVGVALASTGHDAADVVGADGSAESLAIAANAGRYGATAQLDLTESLPFDDGAFDAVVCAGVLTYLPNAEPVLHEFVRVVRSGGAVIVSQRTDLWVERDFDSTLRSLAAVGVRIEQTDRRPYLPALAEYGEQIEVIVVTLHVPGGDT